MEIVVVGAGVIGLTTAIRLREAGYDARIVAADPPLATPASAVAGAIWYPYRSVPDSRAEGWGCLSLDVFWDGALAGLPGLTIRPMVELLPEPMGEPWWADVARSFRRPGPSELPDGYVDGWAIDTVLIDVKPHLAHLLARYTAMGGTVEIRRLDKLDELDADLVVNCTGVGARGLVGDDDVQPIRGQVVRVRGGEVNRVTMVERGPMPLTYIMPHGDECILGGTTDSGEWDRTADDRVTHEIVQRATTLEPSLAEAEIVEVRVGLRPGRSSVRLGLEGRVIHNYGHAGNGWSLSWGCADEVLRLTRDSVG
ncbi:MAG: FAD-binding oxidoreductase [Acidimicrobiia bacterium]|nr:FAD-binding oxidoreductase [Acidimicrobiia bacterium]